MPFITTLLGGGSAIRGWLTIGLVVALVLTGAFAWWQLERVGDRDRTIGTISAQLDEAVDKANRNAAAAAEAQRLERHADRIEVALAERTQSRDARVITVIKEVYRDRSIQTAPGCPDLSPVIADGLDRLRRLRAGEADPGHPDPARPGTRDLAALRPGSGAAAGRD